MGPNPSAALDEYYEIYYIISLKLINRVYNKGIFYVYSNQTFVTHS